MSRVEAPFSCAMSLRLFESGTGPGTWAWAISTVVTEGLDGESGSESADSQRWLSGWLPSHPNLVLVSWDSLSPLFMQQERKVSSL